MKRVKRTLPSTYNWPRVTPPICLSAGDGVFSPRKRRWLAFGNIEIILAFTELNLLSGPGPSDGLQQVTKQHAAILTYMPFLHFGPGITTVTDFSRQPTNGFGGEV
jgi:hypothetical protein